MNPSEYGQELAKSAPPLTPEQVDAAARIFATVEQVAA